MYNQRVIDPSHIPLPFEQRKYTDVCCSCIRFIFVFGLLALSLVGLFQNNKVNISNSCSDGGLLIWNTAAVQNLSCVSSCGNGYKVKGNACFPEKQNQLSVYLQKSKLREMWDRSVMTETVVIIAVFALLLGIIILSLSFLCSSIFPFIIILLFIALSACFGVFILDKTLVPSQASSLFSSLSEKQSVIYQVVAGLVIMLLIGWLVCFCKQLSWNGIMIDSASKILINKFSIVLFTLIFYFANAVILIKFIVQIYAFTMDTPFSIFQIWLYLPNQNIWTMLSLLQFLWNLQYLKDLYNFYLSQMVVDYYWNRHISNCNSFKLFLLHQGSISGGSILSNLFFIPNLLLQFCFCYPKQDRERCSTSCTSLTGLVRSDAYSYIYLAGIPYCNASRQMRQMSNQFNLTKGNNAPIATLRFVLHLFIDCLSVLAGLILITNNQSTVTVWNICLLVIVGQCGSSWLIDMVLHMSQSVNANLLVDLYLAEDINNLSVRDRVIYPVIYEELRHIYFPYDQSRQN